jgi:hypothetical protein
MYRLVYTKAVCLLVSLFVCASSVFSQDFSDNEIKKNVTPINESLKQLNLLNPKTFEYNTGEYRHLDLPSGGQYGFITEEFQQVFPQLVYKKPLSFMSGKNSYKNATVKTINLQGLIPVLIASIKEQQEQITALKKEVEALKRR